MPYILLQIRRLYEIPDDYRRHYCGRARARAPREVRLRRRHQDGRYADPVAQWREELQGLIVVGERIVQRRRAGEGRSLQEAEVYRRLRQRAISIPSGDALQLSSGYDPIGIRYRLCTIF